MYTERIRVNMIKGAFFLALFLVLSIHSFVAEAQSPGHALNGIFKGVGVSYHTRIYTLKSDIPELDGLSVMQEGGQAGIFAGNRMLRARLGLLGLLYSSMRTPRTINVFEVEGGLNYYFLSAANRVPVVEPYLTAGLVYDVLRFRGHYLGNGERVNHSAPEPYLGSIKKMDTTFGAGLEVGIVNAEQFVHLFTEVKYGMKLSQSASNSEFENTSVSNQMMVSLGLRFGSQR